MHANARYCMTERVHSRCHIGVYMARNSSVRRAITSHSWEYYIYETCAALVASASPTHPSIKEVAFSQLHQVCGNPCGDGVHGHAAHIRVHGHGHAA